MADNNFDPRDYNHGVPPGPGLEWRPAADGVPAGWVVPTRGIITGSGGSETMTVWPNVKQWQYPESSFDPRTGGGFKPSVDGYTEVPPTGVRSEIRLAMQKVKQRVASAASGQLVSADFWKLKPAHSYPDHFNSVDPTIVFIPAQELSSINLAAMTKPPTTVALDTRLLDEVHDGAQYLSVVGTKGAPFSIPVIQASRRSANNYFLGRFPGILNFLEFYVHTGNRQPVQRLFHSATVANSHVHDAGFTVGANTNDMVIWFPKGSGVAPVYVSVTTLMPSKPLKFRLEAETKAKSDAAARAKVAAEAKAKADAAARAKARDTLYAKAGVKSAPAYTPKMVKAAEAALGATGVMVLSQAPGAMQLSVAGGGVWTATGEVLSSLGAAIARGIAALSATATAGVAGPMVAAASTILFSAAVGEGSDQVPGRDLEAMFALNAQMLVGQGVKITPGVKSVNLPVRGQLVNSNGQLALELLKTGAGLSATVPVLNAVRDTATGLDKITVPAVAGAPSRTILVNPAPAPSKPSNTGNQKPVPVTPAHTGTQVKPVTIPVTTTTPTADSGRLQDFIYWRPDAAGTGVEPVYVMLGNIYGKTNARGKYSNRPYNTDKAGGPIQNLDWKTASIDRAGVDKVKLHTGRFDESDANRVMIDRLDKILKGELQPTDTDKRFYTHEVRELERYRNLGVKDGTCPDNAGEVWNNTHTATLEDYKLSNNEALLYTPEALKASEEQELRMLK